MRRLGAVERRVYADRVDAETRSFLAHHVGAEHDIPEAIRPRLVGESVSELRADAAALAKQLGIAPQEPARERDEAGRFASTASGTMNRIIREAAGRA
jgi:hypothetical protein